MAIKSTAESTQNIATNFIGDKQSKTCSPGLKVIKLENSLKFKIKYNDWLLADKCPQAANHALCFKFEIELKFYNLKACPGLHFLHTQSKVGERRYTSSTTRYIAVVCLSYTCSKIGSTKTLSFILLVRKTSILVKKSSH